MTSAQVLAREFLEIRAKILELAASFDRLDRAATATGGDSVGSDVRLAQIHEALARLKPDTSARAEQVQMIFSRDYDAAWPQAMGIDVDR